ncbi:hypothetical protein FHG87_010977 [Trinorchestia longiramus]|nr:hypothetical protein FHG87_010977 [Trinorchestia longiramus]
MHRRDLLSIFSKETLSFKTKAEDLCARVSSGLSALAQTAHRTHTKLGLKAPLEPLYGVAPLKYVHEGDVLKLRLLLDNITLTGFSSMTVQEVKFIFDPLEERFQSSHSGSYENSTEPETQSGRGPSQHFRRFDAQGSETFSPVESKRNREDVDKLKQVTVPEYEEEYDPFFYQYKDHYDAGSNTEGIQEQAKASDDVISVIYEDPSLETGEEGEEKITPSKPLKQKKQDSYYVDAFDYDYHYDVPYSGEPAAKVRHRRAHRESGNELSKHFKTSFESIVKMNDLNGTHSSSKDLRSTNKLSSSTECGVRKACGETNYGSTHEFQFAFKGENVGKVLDFTNTQMEHGSQNHRSENNRSPRSRRSVQKSFFNENEEATSVHFLTPSCNKTCSQPQRFGLFPLTKNTNSNLNTSSLVGNPFYAASSKGRKPRKIRSASTNTGHGPTLFRSLEGVVKVAFTGLHMRSSYLVRGNAGEVFSFREKGKFELSTPAVYLVSRLRLVLPSKHGRHGRRNSLGHVVRVETQDSISPPILTLTPHTTPPRWLGSQVQLKLEELAAGIRRHRDGAVRHLIRQWERLVKRLVGLVTPPPGAVLPPH